MIPPKSVWNDEGRDLAKSDENDYFAVDMIMGDTRDNDPLDDSILEEFERKESLLTDFMQAIESLVKSLLAEKGARIHSVSSRLKGKTSLANKISRPDKDYSSLDQITDLCGLRIITYFSDEVDQLADVISAEFTVDTENSVDKRAALDPDRFGYLSLHYVVRLNESRLKLMEYRRFRGCVCEIQIRSILQHAWAEIEHDLGYKLSTSVPAFIRRKFSRLAGLLELGDSEFASIRDGIKNYEKELHADLTRNADSILLDKNSLLEFIKQNKILHELDAMIANDYGAKLVRVSETVSRFAERILPRLRDQSIFTIGGLISALSENRAKLLEFNRAYTVMRKQSGRQPQFITPGTSVNRLLYLLIAHLDASEIEQVLKRWNVRLPFPLPQFLAALKNLQVNDEGSSRFGAQ